MGPLEHRPGAESHGGTCLGTGDSVGHEAVAALPALERPLGRGAEDPVRRHADLALKRAYVAALACRAGLHLGAGNRRRAQCQAAGERQRDKGGNTLPLHVFEAFCRVPPAR
jgi:hypothetical protein